MMHTTTTGFGFNAPSFFNPHVNCFGGFTPGFTPGFNPGFAGFTPNFIGAGWTNFGGPFSAQPTGFYGFNNFAFNTPSSFAPSFSPVNSFGWNAPSPFGWNWNGAPINAMPFGFGAVTPFGWNTPWNTPWNAPSPFGYIPSPVNGFAPNYSNVINPTINGVPCNTPGSLNNPSFNGYSNAAPVNGNPYSPFGMNNSVCAHAA